MARSDLIKDLEPGDIRFFKCTAPKNEIKKTGYITKNDYITIKNTKLKEMIEGLNPVFLLKSNDNLFNYNYCYCYDTSRWYWIEEPPVLLPQGMMEIRCEVDPLYTFMLELGDCMVFEDRSSNIGTGYIEDEEIIFNSSPIGEVYEFSNANGSAAFNGTSYIAQVTNKYAFAKSDYTPGETFTQLTETEQSDAPKPPASSHSIIQAIFDKMDEWRTAEWEYNQDKRNQDNFIDCSSLFTRAFIDACNLDSSKIWEDEGEFNSSCASQIAWWFQGWGGKYALNWGVHGSWAGQPLFGTIALEASQLRPGDLVFFINSDHKDRFPSCWGDGGNNKDMASPHPNGFPDGSNLWSNESFCRDVLGGVISSETSKKWYGIYHIGIVHDCPVTNVNTYTPLKGYTINANGELVIDNSHTATKPKDGGLWLLEGLPCRNRQGEITTMLNGKVTKISTYAKNKSGVVYQKRTDDREVNCQIDEKTMQTISYTDIKKWDFSDNTFAFFIRPDYEKIVQDFALPTP